MANHFAAIFGAVQVLLMLYEMFQAGTLPLPAWPPAWLWSAISAWPGTWG